MMCGRYEAFEKLNPLRDPAWRAYRVYGLIQEGRRPSRTHDGELIHTYYAFVNRYQAIERPSQYHRLRESHPALCSAHQSYWLREWDLWAILQAYLLTDLSLDEIARHIGLTVEAVTYYEQLFYHVRDRLGMTDWILDLLRPDDDGWIPRPRDGTLIAADRHSFYKKMAYQGGHTILEIVVAVLSPDLIMPLSRAAKGIDEKTILRVKGLYALESSPHATGNTLKLIQLTQKLAEQEASADQKPSAKHNDTVPFSVRIEAILSELAASGIKIPDRPNASSNSESDRDAPD